jgi:hypothetical protein
MEIIVMQIEKSYSDVSILDTDKPLDTKLQHKIDNLLSEHSQKIIMSPDIFLPDTISGILFPEIQKQDFCLLLAKKIINAAQEIEQIRNDHDQVAHLIYKSIDKHKLALCKEGITPREIKRHERMLKKHDRSLSELNQKTQELTTTIITEVFQLNGNSIFNGKFFGKNMENNFLHLANEFKTVFNNYESCLNELFEQQAIHEAKLKQALQDGNKLRVEHYKRLGNQYDELIADTYDEMKSSITGHMKEFMLTCPSLKEAAFLYDLDQSIYKEIENLLIAPVEKTPNATEHINIKNPITESFETVGATFAETILKLNPHTIIGKPPILNTVSSINSQIEQLISANAGIELKASTTLTLPSQSTSPMVQYFAVN